MPIENNDVVSMHYELKNDEGNIVDSSLGGDPLNFLVGHQNIIPGLENALLGKEVGAKLEVTVSPAEGYGEVIPELIQQVPMAAFEGVDEVSVGMRFHAETAQGPVPVVITAIEEDIATVDGNHELAGQNLHFSVEIINIRSAEAEEIEHGHVY